MPFVQGSSPNPDDLTCLIYVFVKPKKKKEY